MTGLSEDGRMVLDAADRILREQCTKELVDAAEAGTWPAGLWQTLEASGLTLACAPAELGGAGLAPDEGLSLLRLIGTYAVPVPLAETMLATWLAGAAGIEALPQGPVSIAVLSGASGGATPEEGAVARDGDACVFSGRVSRVPFLPRCEQVLLVFTDTDGAPRMAFVDGAARAVDADVNLAGEPIADLSLADLRVDGAALLEAPDVEMMLGLLALSRALMMSGALASALDLGTSYVLEREQFGRALAKFQAIQQQLAVLAGDVAAAVRAADGALEALGGADALVEIAVAKARAGEAAGRGAEIVHQVHGAMGFTHEHRLHHRTRRLWAWRDEYGHEAYWQGWLGRRIAACGADALWPFMTRSLETPAA